MGKLNVLRYDGDSLGVDGAQVGGLGTAILLCFCCCFRCFLVDSEDKLSYDINTSEIPSEVAFKGATYYVTMTMVISSGVKITCYLHV